MSQFSTAQLFSWLENDCFLLHSQMLVDKKNQLLSRELLIRLNHPDRGILYPENFLPLDSSEPIMIFLDLWVLARSIEIILSQNNKLARSQSGETPEGSLANCHYAINFSSATLNNPELSQKIASLLVPANLFNQLEIEINETTIVNPQMEKNIHYLQELGLTIALDDYGTGNSEISKLKKLPIDKIKIDRSLTADFQESRTKAIIKNLVKLCNDLNIVVCAEGIETKAEFQAMDEFGCTQFQGYFFDRPKLVC